MLATKRALDIGCSVAGLLVFWPLFVVIAIAIRLDSPGPVFFRQERIGRGGEVFRIHKFRTMSSTTSYGPLISSHDDVRITRAGAVLRNTKLDELPQLIDVLRGSMSLVGPRPEVPKYVQSWPAHARDRILSVRPGITDPASLHFRHEGKLLAEVEDPEDYYVRVLIPEKCRMYVDYADNFSVLGDVWIILNTIVALGRR